MNTATSSAYRTRSRRARAGGRANKRAARAGRATTGTFASDKPPPAATARRPAQIRAGQVVPRRSSVLAAIRRAVTTPVTVLTRQTRSGATVTHRARTGDMPGVVVTR